MNQIRFLWAINSIPGLFPVEQKEYGLTVAKITKGINIIHNANKRDKMTILFHETGDVYLIPDYNVLREILQIAIDNNESSLLIHSYCDKNLVHE